MTWLVVVGQVLVGAGTALIAIAGVGLLRLPDAYNQMNATAKAASLGLVLTMLGVLALRPGVGTAVTVALAATLQLLTAPVGGYALAHAAYRSGAPLASATRYDELADAQDGGCENPTKDSSRRGVPRRGSG